MICKVKSLRKAMSATSEEEVTNYGLKGLSVRLELNRHTTDICIYKDGPETVIIQGGKCFH